MRPRRSPLLALLPTLLLPLVAAVPAAAQEAVPDAATLSLPARLPAVPTIVDDLTTSATFVAHGFREFDAPEAPPSTLVRRLDTGRTQVVPGLSPVDAAGDVLLLRPRNSLRLVLLDTRTGVLREVTAPERLRTGVAALPDGGWAETAPSGSGSELVLHGPDDAVTSRTALSSASVSFPDIDERGAVLVADGPEGRRFVQVDVATGQERTLTTRPGANCLPVLGPGVVVWCEPGRVVRASRDDLAVQSVRTLDTSRLGSLVATPVGTGWITSRGPDASLGTIVVTVLSSREDDPARVTALSGSVQTQFRQLTGVGDDLAVVGGAAPGTRGVYRVPVGSSTSREVLSPVGPTAPRDVAASLGRLAVTQATATDGTLRRDLRSAAVGGGRLGAEQPLVRGAVGAALVSGGLTSGLVPSGAGANGDLVVSDGTSAFVRRPVPQGTPVSLSGASVVVEEGSLGLGPSRVVDLRWAADPDLVVDGLATLRGRSLLRVTGDGTVSLRDLDGGTERVLRPAGGLPATLRRGQASVALDDGWALWSLRGPDGAAVETVARRLDGPEEVRLPAGSRAAALAGRRLAWVDAQSVVRLRSLDDGTERVLGRRADPSVRPSTTLTLSEDLVAWTADDGSTRVVELALPTGPPTLLGGFVPRRFAGTGLVLRLAVDRPLDRVELVITDAGGREVARTTSTAPRGDVRAVWDGRLRDGSPAPAGSYRWSLSADGPSGTLQPTAAVPLSGTAVLDRTPPTLVVTSPVATSDGSTTPRARLGWSSDDPGARFTVTVEGRLPTSSTGAYSWGQPVTWRSGVPAGSAVYDGKDQVYGLFPQSLLRFTYSVQDEAGQVRTAVRSIVTPYDDRRDSLRLSSGWTRQAQSTAWAGTVTSTSAAGRTLTVKAVTNRVVVIGARCRGCGRFTVTVDGKLLRTVDTGGASGTRRRLVDLALPGSPALHTVVLRTEGTRGRPVVRLDGVGLVR